jgi:hypothetical protein
MPTPDANVSSVAPSITTPVLDIPTSAPYAAMAWSLAAWFGVVAASYVALLVARRLRRVRALHRELAMQELATLCPSPDSALPAPPNPDLAEPPMYAEIA